MGTKPGVITLQGLVDELARVCHESESARMLVLRAGFPAADLPAFDVPRVFWSRVIRAAVDGKLFGGARALVDEGARQYPGNVVFAAYRAQTVDPAEGPEPSGSELAASSLARTSRPSVLPEQPRYGEREAIDNRRAGIVQQIIVQGDATFGSTGYVTLSDQVESGGATEPADVIETEGKGKQATSAPLDAKSPPELVGREQQAAVPATPRLEPKGSQAPKPVEYRLSILHVSDLHVRSAEVDGLPDAIREQRRRQVHREAASRARVLGPAWEQNLRELYANGERPDMVCFTGDVADWGLPREYAKASEFVDRLAHVLGITKQQIYAVPGNHDVQRYVNEDEWRALRKLLPDETRAVSEWLAGGAPPRAVDDRVVGAVLQRTAVFWQWVAQALGRPELLPAGHAHGRLGYHHVVSVPRLPFDVHVIGLDSAWLAGDDHDQGKLWLTAHQRDMLLHDEHGLPWRGFRLALVHHPLEELAQSDAGAARRTLAETVDLLLHGHQHDPVGSSTIDLDGRTLRVLAAGCLYEGSEGAEWKNGCHRVDITLNGAGRPLRAEIQFRAWSRRGHWHADSSLYRTQTSDGRMVWDAWDGSRRTPAHDVTEGHDAGLRAESTEPSRVEARGDEAATHVDDRRETSPPLGSAALRAEVSDARDGAPPMLGGGAMGSTVPSDSELLPGSVPNHAWNAVAALEPILQVGPASFVEALERAMSGSVGALPSRARRVALAIDALGSGPNAAKRLLEACNSAWAAVKKSQQPGEVLAASKALVRELSSLWLPRRYGDGTKVKRIDRLGSEGACLDLVVTTNDAIITDVHVAAEDDRRLDVGPGSGGAGAPVARLALPEPVALAAEPTDSGAAAEEIIKAFSSQLGVLLVNTPETRQSRIRGHLQLLRDHGEPRYVVLTPRSGIVDATLVALKKIFPPLRIVSIEGSLDEDEARILDILVHFFSDG